MAITVCGNCIEFGGSYTLCSTAPGFGFDGVIKAVQGFCDTRLFQGTNAGFLSGGAPLPTTGTSIQSFPFATPATTTCVGDLCVSREGASPATNFIGSVGYTAGGESSQPGHTPNTDSINKFPFSSSTTSTDVGELTCARRRMAGQSSSTHGFATGGYEPPAVRSNVMDCYPFASDNPATDAGDLSCCLGGTVGQSSTTDGYSTGGNNGQPFPNFFVNRIDKFPFSSTSGATCVAALTSNRIRGGGQSSATDGFHSGGNSPPEVDDIDKFPFASNSPASSHGELIAAADSGSLTGISSTVDGYNVGSAGPTNFCAIQKFPFASSSGSTDVGETSTRLLRSNGHND